MEDASSSTSGRRERENQKRSGKAREREESLLSERIKLSEKVSERRIKTRSENVNK